VNAERHAPAKATSEQVRLGEWAGGIADDGRRPLDPDRTTMPLGVVRPLPTARWVVLMALLAYEMNGEPLLEAHGAPPRLRNEVELGFKQVKWIGSIEFVESFDHIGQGKGGYNDHEYYGYQMPI